MISEINVYIGVGLLGIILVGLAFWLSITAATSKDEDVAVGVFLSGIVAFIYLFVWMVLNQF